ncbi:MAG: FtsX-like permease family protein, partial [Gammaproteobacteria bacterium]|nr:FtsX-like permease family protein [Gammaproteobacteria bacterium]
MMPRMRRFTVAAIFEVGMHEFDKNVAFIHIKDAARLYRMGDAVSGVRLYTEDPFTAGDTAVQVAEAAGGLYYVQDWTRNNRNLFRQVAATKQILFIVLLLVIAIAAFNIVSTLMLVIDDKQGDIAILRTMGAKARQIMAVFMTQGAVIGVIGTIWGVVLGIILALNIERIIGFFELTFDLDILADDVYLITDLPSAINWPDIVLIALIAIGLSLAATLYPAWKASRTEPAQVLRHE